MLRVLAAALALFALPSLAAAQGSFPVSIRVDAARSEGELAPIWRFFGGDEPNYGTMRDGRELLGHLGALSPGNVYFRTHNLLNTGDGTPSLKWGSTNAYTEDAEGKPVYDWTILDRLFDTYLERGVRPYVEIGFMPEGLSIQPQPYASQWRLGFNYARITAGWAYPPDDYDAWRELVYQWVLHCVERYGREEVETWYWQVWNEPNLDFYWRGSPEDFYKLHDYAVDGVRRALPTARVGGPDVAGSGGAFMEGFLDHVTTGTNHATGARGTPTDFLAFHAKGAPSWEGDHIRMGIANHLRTIDTGFAMIAARPATRRLPIVIGESDPEGCAACQGPTFSYRNGTVYSSYTAASFPRIHELAARHRVTLHGALTWAFEFEDQPYFAGFRQLATNGVDLPVLNVFRMFSMMGPERIAARSNSQVPLATMLTDGVRDTPDVGVMASRGENMLAILVWHYHDDDVAGPDAAVTLDIAGVPRALRSGATLTHYRVDETHSNAYGAWRRMNSPPWPNEEQYAQLEEAAQLASIGPATPLQAPGGRATIDFNLPRQGVSLLVLSPSGS